MSRMRRSGLILPLLGGSAIAAVPAGAQSDSPRVDSVVVVTQNVFDPAEARRSFLFRLANALHVTTRPAVVAHELLFAAGEPYDSASVAETQRNLRALGLFRDVEIDTVRAGDRLLAVVRTADGWTTELILNARSTGETFSWAVGAQERNFLGTGTRVGVSYRDEPDRTAFRVSGAVPRYRGTRLAAEGFYDDLSDGSFGAWSVGLPFRAVADPLGVVLSGEAGRERVLQFRDGDSSATYRRRLLVQRATLAVAPRASSRGYLRAGLSGQVRREEYLLWDTPSADVPDTVTAALGAFVDFLRTRFLVVTHYNGFARDEDIDLSTRLTLSAWLAPAAFGYREGGIGPSLAFQTGGAIGRHFARLEATANGLFTSAGLDSGQVRAEATVALRPLAKHATVLHLSLGVRRGTPPGAEFDLGHGRGPRAFGPHAFTGDRSVWGSVEHRAFVIDEFAGLVGVPGSRPLSTTAERGTPTRIPAWAETSASA